MLGMIRPSPCRPLFLGNLINVPVKGMPNATEGVPYGRHYHAILQEGGQHREQREE